MYQSIIHMNITLCACDDKTKEITRKLPRNQYSSLGVKNHIFTAVGKTLEECAENTKNLINKMKENAEHISTDIVQEV